MTEVLSQNQIDALLDAVQSNGEDVSALAEELRSDEYRQYDFSSPRKFTKDRIKMLVGVFENYCRIANTVFSARMRINCQFEVESIDEKRFYEFSNSLTDGDVLAMMDVVIKEKQPEDTPAMLYLSTPTALSLMDRMLGGDGDNSEEIPADYSYTDLELRLYEELVKDLISMIGRSWENYIPIQFSYSKTDINPTLSQVMGLDEIIVIVNLKMQLDSMPGNMSICLPSEMLKSIFTEISIENPYRKTATESKSELIFNSLRDSKLEIVSILGETQLTLSDIYHLNPGDIIDLGKPKDSSVYLDIGNYHWFTGKVGTHKKNMAVRIDEVLEQAVIDGGGESKA